MKAHETSGYLKLLEGLRQSHLPALDGLRAVAVFLVIFYHAGLPFPGGLGVLIFFVLSGFLITWLLLKEADRNGTVSLLNFYIRRCLRIFPAFYVYSAVYLASAWAIGKSILWPQAWAALLYVNNYYQGLHGDPNTGFSHTWSLSVEEQFYVLWPSIFLFCRRRSANLSKILAVGIAFVWVYRVVLAFVLHVNHGYIYEAFDTRADSLMIGCLLAILLRNGKGEKIFGELCKNSALPLITLGLLLGSVFLELKFGAVYRDSVGMSLDVVLTAILIVQMIAFQNSVGWGWLNWRWVRWLGILSYSLYLYQQIAVRPAEKLALHLPSPMKLVVIVAAVLGCAVGSYYMIEKPLLNVKQRFEPSARRDVMEAASQ